MRNDRRCLLEPSGQRDEQPRHFFTLRGAEREKEVTLLFCFFFRCEEPGPFSSSSHPPLFFFLCTSPRARYARLMRVFRVGRQFAGAVEIPAVWNAGLACKFYFALSLRAARIKFIFGDCPRGSKRDKSSQFSARFINLDVIKIESLDKIKADRRRERYSLAKVTCLIFARCYSPSRKQSDFTRMFGRIGHRPSGDKSRASRQLLSPGSPRGGRRFHPGRGYGRSDLRICARAKSRRDINIRAKYPPGVITIRVTHARARRARQSEKSRALARRSLGFSSRERQRCSRLP